MPNDTAAPPPAAADADPYRDISPISPTGAVTAAFGDLIAALRGVIADDPAACDRAISFRKHVADLAARWSEGRPAHGTGSRKGGAS